MCQKIPVEQQGFCKKEGDIQLSVCVEAGVASMPSQNFSVLVYQMTVPRRPHQGRQAPELRASQRERGGTARKHSHTALTVVVLNLLSLGRGTGLGRAPDTVASSCPFQPSPELTGVQITQLPFYNTPSPNGHCSSVNGTNSCDQRFLFMGLNRNQILPQINL